MVSRYYFHGQTLAMENPIWYIPRESKIMDTRSEKQSDRDNHHFVSLLYTIAIRIKPYEASSGYQQEEKNHAFWDLWSPYESNNCYWGACNSSSSPPSLINTNAKIIYCMWCLRSSSLNLFLAYHNIWFIRMYFTLLAYIAYTFQYYSQILIWFLDNTTSQKVIFGAHVGDQAPTPKWQLGSIAIKIRVFQSYVLFYYSIMHVFFYGILLFIHSRI